MNRRDFTLALLASAATLRAGHALADAGVSADKIVFGQAAPFEGPASALGLGMREGISAAFAEVNAKGGVKGRKLELKIRDDGYEPTKSIEATKALLTQDNVFALVGPVGTPTSAATQPIAAEGGVPFIGPFTGAEFLRNPHKPNVVNVRASYFQETEEMVERLTKDLKVERIAIFFQDDAYGRAGLAGVNKAMEKRKMTLVAEGTYERNTTAVKSALLEIKKADPQAVIMVGAYKPCAEFIKLARQIKLEATFVNISFVGSDALAAELGEQGAGVVVTQVVPFPQDKGVKLVADYQAALKTVRRQDEAGLRQPRGLHGGALGDRRPSTRSAASRPARALLDVIAKKQLRPGRRQAGLRRHRQSGHGRGVPHRHPEGRLASRPSRRSPPRQS